MGLLLAALSAVLLACSLSVGGDESPTSSNTTDSGGQPGSVPIVRVLDPASGATVPSGQPVNITVESDTSATRFQLNVGGQVAGTVSLPPGQQGPTQAILSWLPPGQGTYDLEVVAYNGALISVPATLQLVVSGTAASAPSGGACIGRVLVSQLNFRDAPGTNASRLGQFEVGETVAVLGRNSDTSWYQVGRAGGQSGWVVNNAQWFQVEGACSALPVTG
jgi:hypothetical protein